MKKGSLYYEWIKRCLIADEPNTILDEIESFLNDANTYDLLERVSHSAIAILQDFIFQITDAIGWSEELCDELWDTIEKQIDDTEIIQKAKSDIALLQKTEEGRQAIALALFRTIASIHVYWIRDNQTDYYERYTRHNEQYLFMPIELTGWSNAKRYLSYIELLLKEFGIEYDEKNVKEVYNQSLIRMLKRNGLMKNFIELCLKDGLIASCLLRNKHEGIYTQLTDPDFIKTTLMPQLKDKGFGQDPYIVLLMEEEGYFKFR